MAVKTRSRDRGLSISPMPFTIWNSGITAAFRGNIRPLRKSKDKRVFPRNLYRARPKAAMEPNSTTRSIEPPVISRLLRK